MSHWPTKTCFRCSRVPDYTPKACDACRDFAAYLTKYKAQLDVQPVCRECHGLRGRARGETLWKPWRKVRAPRIA